MKSHATRDVKARGPCRRYADSLSVGTLRAGYDESATEGIHCGARRENGGASAAGSADESRSPRRITRARRSMRERRFSRGRSRATRGDCRALAPHSRGHAGNILLFIEIFDALRNPCERRLRRLFPRRFVPVTAVGDLCRDYVYKATRSGTSALFRPASCEWPRLATFRPPTPWNVAPERRCSQSGEASRRDDESQHGRKSRGSRLSNRTSSPISDVNSKG